MRAAWRLGINGLVGRRSRTVLLVLAVTLASALVTAVACALASVNKGMEQRVLATLGRADLRVRDIAGQRLDARVLELIEKQPEVEVAAPRARGSITFRPVLGGETWTSVGIGIDPAREYRMLEPSLSAGRRVEADDEVVISPDLADELKAKPGDVLEVVRFGKPMSLEVVGVSSRGDVDVVRRTEAVVTRAALSEISGVKDRLTEIAVVLREGADAKALSERYQALVPKNVIVQTTALVTSGVGKAVRANTLGSIAASALAYFACALIILTGLTTGVLERQRELAIMRALGAERATLASGQLLIGGLIGAAGAVLGLPLGIAMAWTVAEVYPDKLPAGLVLPPMRLAGAFGGAVLAGLVGASWPAFAAARTRPLRAMAGRARPATRRTLIGVALLGVACVGAQLAIVEVPDNGEVVFFGHIVVGLPLMLIGYFLLGVPLVIVAGRVVAPVVAWVFRVPRTLLSGSLRGSPIRNGFTAAALMLGVAMMTDLWTVGQAVLRDWIGSIQFPDAFANDWSGLDQADVERIRGLDFIGDVCPITLFKIDNKSFGIAGIKNHPTNFVAFEPEAFFRMTRLSWVAGDEAYARRRLDEGGAVLVAQEFLVARKGYRIGDSFSVFHQGVRHEFEVVGAVSSPGLDLVGYAFDLGREYQDVAIGAVFGTRADLKKVFASEAVHLVQMSFKGDITDTDAAARIRAALNKPGVIVGSGREIKEGVLAIGRSSMRIASIIAAAAAAMVIAGLGVGNIVLAGIDARRFEFGVLRAVGATRGVLGCLIIAEVVVLVLCACVLGTVLGMQASNTARRLYELLAGIRLTMRPPVVPIAAGWAMLMVITLGITLPLVLRLTRLKARELLASTKG